MFIHIRTKTQVSGTTSIKLCMNLQKSGQSRVALVVLVYICTGWSKKSRPVLKLHNFLSSYHNIAYLLKKRVTLNLLTAVSIFRDNVNNDVTS